LAGQQLKSPEGEWTESFAHLPQAFPAADLLRPRGKNGILLWWSKSLRISRGPPGGLDTRPGGFMMGDARLGSLRIGQRSLSMSALRRVEVNEVGEVTVVHFRDQKIIEDLGIQEMGQELFQLVEGENRKKLVLNFSSVDFLSSAALGKLITLDKKTKARGGSLKLCNIRPEIYEVFAITRLNRLFDIRDDEADALAAF
jgi:anti-sigma B factor antagonist